MIYTITVSVDEEMLRYVTSNTIDPLEDILYQEIDTSGLMLSGIDIISVKEEENDRE